MVILRPTRKLGSLLPAAEIVPTRSDTALGDWYVDRVVIDRRPLLLLVSSTSLLPMLLPARDVRGLPTRLGGLVEARLKRLGIEAHTIEAEKLAMVPVIIGSTADRSVLGIMTEFARSLPYYLEGGQWNETALPLAEERLSETPCHAARSANRVIFPDRTAPAVLRARWLANKAP
jgi:hypothetical protein